MHLRLLSSPDTAGTGVFRVRMPHPIPTCSSVALRTPQPTLASPMLSPPRSSPPIGPVSVPDWPDLCHALRIAAIRRLALTKLETNSILSQESIGADLFMRCYGCLDTRPAHLNCKGLRWRSFFLEHDRVHLLYLDESGSVADPNQTYFVLAGVCVFERLTHWVEEDLNNIAKRFDPSDPYSIELHGSPMRSGRDGWKARASLQDRTQAMKDALRVGVQASYPNGVRLFGAVVKKSALSGTDPVEHAFEQLCNSTLLLCPLAREAKPPCRTQTLSY